MMCQMKKSKRMKTHKRSRVLLEALLGALLGAPWGVLWGAPLT